MAWKRRRQNGPPRSHLKRWSAGMVNVGGAPSKIVIDEYKHRANNIAEMDMNVGAKEFEIVLKNEGFFDHPPFVIWREAEKRNWKYVKLVDRRFAALRLYFDGPVWFFVKHDKGLDTFTKSRRYWGRDWAYAAFYEDEHHFTGIRWRTEITAAEEAQMRGP